jgi:hypothetical protein
LFQENIMLPDRNPLPTRARAIVIGLGVALMLTGVTGYFRLDLSPESAAPRKTHSPNERVALLEKIAFSIVPADAASATNPSCVELENVKHFIDERLAFLAMPQIDSPAVINAHYVLDTSRWPDFGGTRCSSFARALETEVKRSWPLFTAPGSWRENAFNKNARYWKNHAWRPRLADLATPDAWAYIPGCIRSAKGVPIAGVCEQREARGLTKAISDPWLSEGIGTRMANLAWLPSKQMTNYRGKPLPLGSDARLTFDPALQQRADKLARCWVGETDACADVLPEHLKNDWHFQPGMLRSGAAAAMLIKVRTGEVVAAAGALSECSRNAMGQRAETVDDQGQQRLPLFKEGGGLCAQIPDARGAQGYLTFSPLFWPVGPGSTNKTCAFLAGIESGVLSPAQDKAMLGVLARSHDDQNHGQELPQQIARQSSVHYRKLMHYLGFDTDADMDVLAGLDTDASSNAPRHLPATWPLPVRMGFTSEAYIIDEGTYRKIYAAKKAGRNADALYGHKNVAEYLKAHQLSISAIGSGDVRQTVFGLADWTRRLVLRSEGRSSMTPTRMATLNRKTLPSVPLDFAKPESVRRLIGMLSGATASNLGGTTSGSCRFVFGTCPASGHPGVVFSKTGTAETGSGGEASPWVKQGGAGTPPAKLYMAAFKGSDGEMYAGGRDDAADSGEAELQQTRTVVEFSG